jgi:hypothetical protein
MPSNRHLVVDEVHHPTSFTEMIRLTVCALFVALASAGCGSDSSDNADKSVGGMVECTESAVLEGLDYEVDGVISLECDDGWAVVFVATTDSAGSYDTNEVLEAEGQFWILKDSADVCGTVSLDDPTTRPDDAQVPASLWSDGCATS